MPSDIIFALYELLPDIRAIASSCSEIHNISTLHPDMNYWRADKDTREKYLTNKIYAEFRCANTENLVRYNRRDIYSTHVGRNVTEEFRKHIRGVAIKYDARDVLEYILDGAQFDLRNHVYDIGSAEQLKYLRGKSSTSGMTSIIFPLLIDGQDDKIVLLAQEFGENFTSYSEKFAIREGKSDIIIKFIKDKLSNPRAIFHKTLEEGKYAITAALLDAGHNYGVPEDKIEFLIPELSPAGLYKLAETTDVCGAADRILAGFSPKTAKLVRPLIRLGAKIRPEVAEKFMDDAALAGDLEAVLTLKKYLHR